MSKTIEVTVKVTVDEEKMQTLMVYLPQEEKTLDAMLQETVSHTLDRLFSKNVPVAVQNFLSLKNGIAPVKPARPRPIPKDKKGKTQDGQSPVIADPAPEPEQHMK